MHKIKLFLIPILLFVFSDVKAQEILELSSAIDIALKNNYSIVIAQNQALIAETNNTLGNAGFLPAVGANFFKGENFNETRQEFFNGEIREGSNVRTSNTSANVQLNWTLFDGLNMFATRQMLQEFEELGELNAKIRIDQTISQVIATYYAIVQQQKQVKTIKNAIEISIERKRIAEEKFNIGSGSGLEMLQASVDINSDSSALLRQEFELIKTKAAFNELLVREPETPFIVNDIIEMKEALLYEELSLKVMQQNPELLVAQRNIKIADMNLKQARSTIFPTVSVSSGYNYSSFEAQLGLLQSNLNRGVSYGLTASWNLFDGFTQKTRRQVAQIEIMNQDNSKKQTELRLKNELYQLYTSYVTSKSLIGFERKNKEVAQQNLDISTEKMKLGTITAIELREAQRNLIDTEFRLIMTEYEAKLTETELLRLSGQLVAR
ncbi:MAG: TolC family protein [Bacteroidota bacterium]|nr:TolC family protein [Bacteroidota bacterium]